MISLMIAALLTAATPAKPANDPGSWVTMNDYPSDALKQHQEGPVAFSVDVDSAGSVVACRVSQSSGASSLDSATCALLFVRARFEPARDDKGLPVAGVFASRVRWVYPSRVVDSAGGLKPVEVGVGVRSGTGASELHVNADGVITACDAAPRPYSNVLAPPDVCKIFPVGSRYSAPSLAKGKPVKRKLTITFNVVDVNVK